MPYSGPNDPDLPAHVQRLSEAKRRQWIAVFEEVLADTGDEGRAMAAANAAVKQSTAVKALDDKGRVGGYLVVWGDASQRDLQGEYFTPDTDLALDWYARRPVLYHHGRDKDLGPKMIGHLVSYDPDEVGVWVEGQLELRAAYERAVWGLVRRNKLGWSSGALPHLVEVERDGRIKRWPIVEGSLTPRPAEPRGTAAVAMKHLCDRQHLEHAYKSAGLDLPDLLMSEIASEGGTTREHSGVASSGAFSHRPQSSPMEDDVMGDENQNTPVKTLTEEQARALFQKMREDEKAEQEREALEARAAKAAELEEENARLKAQVNGASDTPPARRLPGREADADPGADGEDDVEIPDANKAFDLIPTRDLRFDHMGAEDMAWGLSYMKSLEKATGKAMVSGRYIRATAEKVWQAGYRFLDEKGHALKDDELIHTAQTDYGAEWIPDVWSGDVWMRARAENVVFNLFNTIEMPTATVKIRIEGTDPKVYFVPETQDESQLTLAGAGNPIPDSKIGSGSVQLDAKKLALRVGFSMEETEDAMIPVIPLYRAQANRAMANAIDNVILNGDTETGATDNINSDDEAPAATDKFLVFDGLRKLGLVTNTAMAVDANGAPTRNLLNSARFAMPMRHALRTGDLAWIVDGSTYSRLLLLDEVSTVDKYGPAATVLTGEIGRIDNIPVLPSAEFPLTEPDGKVSFDTPANNVKGQAVCVYRPGWIVGFVRRVTANLAYLPYYDAYQMVASMRIALVRFDTTVASVLYDITV